MSDAARRDAWLKSVIGFDVEAAVAAAAASPNAFVAAATPTGQRRSGVQIGQRPAPAAPFAPASVTPGRQRSGVQIGSRPAPAAASAGYQTIPAEDQAMRRPAEEPYENVTEEERAALVEGDPEGGYNNFSDEEKAARASAAASAEVPYFSGLDGLPEQPKGYQRLPAEDQAMRRPAEEPYENVTEEERGALVEGDPEGGYNNFSDEEKAARGGAAAPASVAGQVDPNGSPAVAQQPGTGMKGKRVGAEYAGEHNKYGWRSEDPVAQENVKVARTRLHTEEERAGHTLKLGEDGAFTRQDGTAINHGAPIGYAMDPKTGEMVSFDNQVRGVKPDGSIVAGTRASLMEQRKQGEQVVTEIPHHSTALGGDVELDDNGQPRLDKAGKPIMKSREAASAGYVKFDLDGRLVEISNVSGHYKPGVDALMQAVEYLSRQGAYISGDLADANGDPVTPNSPAGKLRAELEPRLAKLPALLAKVKTLTAAMGGEKSAEADTAADEVAAIQKEINTINAAADMLRRAGVAPDGKMRDTRVEYVVPGKAMTGMEVIEQPTRLMETEEFLRTGGGNIAQAVKKDALLDEIERDATGRRARAEVGAVEGTGKVQVPTADELTAASAALRGEEQESGSPSREGQRQEVAESPGGQYEAYAETDVASLDLSSAEYTPEPKEEAEAVERREPVEADATDEPQPAAAAATEPEGEQADDLQHRLNWLLLRVSDYAENADQQADWTKRLLAAGQTIEGNPQESIRLMSEVGEEIAKAASAKKAAEGPLKDWEEEFDKFREIADKFASDRLEQLREQGDGNGVEQFKLDWDNMEDELAALNDAVEKGFNKAMKGAKETRAKALTGVADEAKKGVARLRTVKGDDGETLMPDAVLRGLDKAVAEFRKAVAESK